MAILDQNGIDVLQGLGQNRSPTASQEAPILYTSTSVNPVIDESDTLTLVIDTQFVPSAQLVVDLYYALGA